MKAKKLKRVVDREEKENMVFTDYNYFLSSPTKKYDYTLVRRGVSGTGCDEANPVDPPVPLFERIDFVICELRDIQNQDFDDELSLEPEINRLRKFESDVLLCLKEAKTDFKSLIMNCQNIDNDLKERLCLDVDEIFDKRFFGDANGK